MVFNCTALPEDKAILSYELNDDDLRIQIFSEDNFVYLSKEDSIKIYNLIKNKFKLGD